MSERTESSIKRIHREKLFFFMIAGAIGIMLLVMGGYQLVEFMDSTAFCGRLCHDVMYPEYTAFQASPHSRVLCSECHVGSGADYLVRSKLSGVPLIFSTLFGTYHRPIPTPVENLRPARETCEQCHRPERFAGDLVRQHTNFAEDEQNTKSVDIRVLRVGGGEQEAAQDIHWHIAANVWYLPLDDLRQDIAWVGVEGADGEIASEYVDPQIASISPEVIEQERRLMDCIDCHNRATHIFSSPEELIDLALAQGTIDGSLPYIKRQGLWALVPQNSSLEMAVAKVDTLDDWYRKYYPEVHQEKPEVITEAIDELKEIARLTTFPFMRVDWNTYLDNSGHTESQGCLRCHGKLVSAGDGEDQVVDDSCDLCHYFELR